jgi:hypothetical protein
MSDGSRGSRGKDGPGGDGVSPPKKDAAQPAVLVSRVVDVGWQRAPSPASVRGTKPIAHAAASPPIPEEPPTEKRPQVAPSPHSQRPRAPDEGAFPLEAPSSPSIEATFERLLGSFDEAMDGIVASERNVGQPPASSRVADENDLKDVRELFAQLAAKHARPVRDFMIELRWNEARSTWLGACASTVQSLRTAADRLVLTELCAALDAYGKELATAASHANGAVLDGAPKEALLATYARLAELMPQAFALDLDQSQRESVIVHALLSQVPGVRKAAIDRIFGAGLATLSAMEAARADDLAEATGIDRVIAARIVERFKHYKTERNETKTDAAHTEERARLAQLLKRLRYQHDEHERAAADWSDDARAAKRRMREARQATMLEINVVLARLGETERVKTLEKLPFGRKVEELEAYLVEAERASHGA